jgi:hypothetical protein
MEISVGQKLNQPVSPENEKRKGKGKTGRPLQRQDLQNLSRNLTRILSTENRIRRQY